MNDGSRSDDAVARNVRGSGVLLVASGAAAVAEMAAHVIAARYLAKDEFGALSYALSLVLLLETLCVFGMPLTVARYISQSRERGDRSGQLGTIFFALAVAGVLSSMVMFLLLVAPWGTLAGASPETITLAQALAVLIPTNCVTAVLTSFFAAYRQTTAIIIRVSILGPLLKLTVASTLIWAHTDVGLVAGGYAVAGVLATIIYVALALRLLLRQRLLRGGVRPVLPAQAREMISFGSATFLTTLVWVLLESADALIVGHFHGEEEVATLRAATLFMRGNALVLAAFILLYTPLAATYVEREDRGALQDLYVRTAAWLATLSFPVFALSFIFAKDLVTTVYGDAYAASSSVLVILSVGYFAQTLTGYNGQTLKIYGHLRFAVAVDLLAVTGNVLLNIYAVPRWGALGAAGATSVTLMAHNLAKQVGLRRLAGIRIVERAYVRLLATAGGLVAGLAVVESTVDPGILLGGVLTLGATVLLTRWNSGLLRPGDLVPQIEGVGVLRRVFIG